MDDLKSPGGEADPKSGYALGYSDQELERLRIQARLIDPITRRFFLEAGLGPGMRVLDVGSGSGDVTFLAAEIVGAQGEVVGTDRAATAVAAARDHATARLLGNVSFRVGDPAALTFEQPFDAVVCRYVLGFQSDPAMMVRKLAAHVRPGGLIIFHEADFDTERSFPPVLTYDRCCQWVRETLRLLGTDPQVGIKLHAIFVAAGLPAPVLRVESIIAGGATSVDHVHFKTDLARTIFPDMERLGVATAREVQIHTLAEQVLADVIANNSIIVGRSEIGAWSRL